MASLITDAQLLELPLFAGLTPAEIADLPAHATVEEHRRGTYLFHRGDPGDALYVVLSGQIALELATHTAPRLLALCGPGDWFGELALLTVGPRTADARVAVDAALLRIDRHGWTALSQRAPHLFARLCERLGRQLRAGNEPPRAARRSVIACGDPGGSAPSWAPGLLRSLRRQFPDREAHLLAADGTPLGGTITAPMPRPDPGMLATAIARLVAPDALILVPADVDANLADSRLRRLGPAEWTLEPGRRGQECERIRAASADAALDRVARHLAGGTIGLALGAGGAFGFAHLGLLRVLASAGIPVDCIAGTSMGAVLGGIIAAGVPAARAIEWAGEGAGRFNTLLLRDLNLRGRTLLTGSTFMGVIAELDEVREATFESLEIPFLAVAMDVAAGEEVILDSGPLLDGIRPSFAMPGVFPPCPVGPRLLIDGAVVNPVPVDRARALGADVVIASQPIPPLQPDAVDPLGTFVGSAARISRLLPLRGLRDRLQTVNVSLRSFQAMWYRLATASVLAADVAVSPDLRAFWFLQFSAAAPIIEAGQRSAEAALPGIRTMLRERVGLAVETPPPGRKDAGEGMIGGGGDGRMEHGE